MPTTQESAMSIFTPTHEITFTPRHCSPTVTQVQLCEDEPGAGGPAYTREEWDADSSADWERSEDGSWTCLGEATPGGATGTVEVCELKPHATVEHVGAAYYRRETERSALLQAELDRVFGAGRVRASADMGEAALAGAVNGPVRVEVALAVLALFRDGAGDGDGEVVVEQALFGFTTAD